MRLLMGLYAERARIYYDRAAALLPPEDRRLLRPAEAMGRIYRELLEELQRRGFPCLHGAVRLSRSHRLALAAAAHSPESGIWLRVHTTQPALQFYTGEYLDKPLQVRGGFCFEAQNFPDAPNKPAFPSAVLEPGQTYAHSILYEFGCADSLPI